MNPKYLFCALAIALISCGGKNSSDKKTSNGVIIRAPESSATDSITIVPAKGVKNLSDVTDIYSLLCQGWENEDDLDALDGMDDNSTMEIAFRAFYLNPDGSFVKNPRNAWEYGTWTYDDATKTITFNYKVDGGKDVYKIVALAPDELQLMNQRINTITRLKFVSSGLVFNDPSEEPFALVNNRWRIHPGQPETDAAIRQRLKANLHFFLQFYKAAIDKDMKQVSFWGLPSCLKWYAGGIYLQNKELLSKRWTECFYNKEQAMKAYAMMSKVMDMKYTWPKGQVNWVQKNAAVLQQMYDNLDKVN